jgi:hypothetical protein
LPFANHLWRTRKKFRAGTFEAKDRITESCGAAEAMDAWRSRQGIKKRKANRQDLAYKFAKQLECLLNLLRLLIAVALEWSMVGDGLNHHFRLQ